MRRGDRKGGNGVEKDEEERKGGNGVETDEEEIGKEDIRWT